MSGIWGTGSLTKVYQSVSKTKREGEELLDNCCRKRCAEDEKTR
jgi:hypothetical protein